MIDNLQNIKIRRCRERKTQTPTILPKMFFINMKMIVFSAKDAEGLVISKTDEHAAMQPALFSLAKIVRFYAECNWISAYHLLDKNFLKRFRENSII